jgi:hypothetical protein
MTGRVLSVLQSMPLLILLCLVGVPLVLLRLFGVLFFASTTSLWAVIPALALGVLLATSVAPSPMGRILAVSMLCAYLCSLYFYGWPDLMHRLAEEGDATLDGLEGALIFLLVTRSLLFRQHRIADSS